MANIKSQIKRNRQNEKRRDRNKAARTELKTRIRQASEAAAAGSDDTPEKVRVAQKRLAQAGSKGTVHKRQASRRTSRLMKSTGRAGS
ncbi:MAG: 30S ribosomal protein S20 [Acidimicrobiia bacterium]